MKAITIIILCAISLFVIEAQRPTMTDEIVTETKNIKLKQLILNDTSFITKIDSLSKNTIYPIDFKTLSKNIIYFDFSLSYQNNKPFYSIYVTTESKFEYRSGMFGFLEIEGF